MPTQLRRMSNSGDSSGDIAAHCWSDVVVSSYGVVSKFLIIMGFILTALHGVQGVASSNPAVPTSNTLRGLVMKITNPLSHCWSNPRTLLYCCRCNAVNAGV